MLRMKGEPNTSRRTFVPTAAVEGVEGGGGGEERKRTNERKALAGRKLVAHAMTDTRPHLDSTTAAAMRGTHAPKVLLYPGRFFKAVVTRIYEALLCPALKSQQEAQSKQASCFWGGVLSDGTYQHGEHGEPEADVNGGAEGQDHLAVSSATGGDLASRIDYWQTNEGDIERGCERVWFAVVRDTHTQTPLR